MARIILLLFIHILGDYVLQGKKLSSGKALNFLKLLLHVVIYTAVLIVLSPFALGLTFMQGLIFSLINGGTHLIIDFISGKLKHHYSGKNDAIYYATIVTDFILHISILISSYIYLYPEAFHSISG